MRSANSSDGAVHIDIQARLGSDVAMVLDECLAYPATHDASEHEDENLPRMGERLRLRQDFDTSNFSPEVETILNAMKEYGMFVADNGIDWAISVAPDPRIPNLHEELRKIKGENFEVVTPPPSYKKPR